jgi:hypothetical protein
MPYLLAVPTALTPSLRATPLPILGEENVIRRWMHLYYAHLRYRIRFTKPILRETCSIVYDDSLAFYFLTS